MVSSSDTLTDGNLLRSFLIFDSKDSTYIMQWLKLAADS